MQIARKRAAQQSVNAKVPNEHRPLPDIRMTHFYHACGTLRL